MGIRIEMRYSSCPFEEDLLFIDSSTSASVISSTAALKIRLCWWLARRPRHWRICALPPAVDLSRFLAFLVPAFACEYNGQVWPMRQDIWQLCCSMHGVES